MVNRKDLSVLGITEDDIHTSITLMKQRPRLSVPSSFLYAETSQNAKQDKKFAKEECILGYSNESLKREKAVRMLGTFQYGE